MKTIETSGKTVEEALRAGLKELGCDISEVKNEVLDAGSPGLFGMFGRLARVRLTVKEADTDMDFDMPVLTLNPQTDNDDKKPAKKEKAKPKQPARSVSVEETEKPAEAAVVSDAPEASEKPAAPKARRERTRRERPMIAEAASDETAAQPEIARPELPPLEFDKLGADAKTAYEFLSNVTRMMGVNIDIRMLEEENHLTVEMTGDTLGILIGRRGETMDALQYLCSLTVNKGREEYTRVSLDVEHYRAKREETLRRLAVRMANRAKKTGRRVVLEPMNPYERRVLHSALQNHPGVQTHSEGEEPYRRVIITLK